MKLTQQKMSKFVAIMNKIKKKKKKKLKKNLKKNFLSVLVIIWLKKNKKKLRKINY
jgi:hypothetical protein